MLEVSTTRWYKLQEVAAIANVHVDSVRRWLAAGELSGVKFGTSIRVSEEALEAFVQLYHPAERLLAHGIELFEGPTSIRRMAASSGTGVLA